MKALVMFSPGVGGGCWWGWERAENKDWLQPINILLMEVAQMVSYFSALLDVFGIGIYIYF